MLESSDQAGTATDALSFFREMADLCRHAHEALTRNDADAVLVAVAARARLIEQSTRVVTRFAELQSKLHPVQAGDGSPSGCGADTEALFEAAENAARELRDADARLVECLVAERNRIASELGVVDHGEAVAATYRQSGIAPGSHVDLVR